MIRLLLLEECGLPLQEITVPEAGLLQTATDLKRADQIVECTKSSLLVPGQTADGEVTYTSKYGGVCVNVIEVRHLRGAEGPAYANRPLTFSISDDQHQITITFGKTVGAGVAIVPTAAAVAALVAANTAICPVIAVAGGSGLGPVSELDYTHLSGGLSDGDKIKLAGHIPVCLNVALKETI